MTPEEEQQLAMGALADPFSARWGDTPGPTLLRPGPGRLFEDYVAQAGDRPVPMGSLAAPFDERWGDLPSNRVFRTERNPAQAMRQMQATQGFNQRLGDIAAERAGEAVDIIKTPGDIPRGKFTPGQADPNVLTEYDVEAQNRGIDQLIRRAPLLGAKAMYASTVFPREPNSLGVFGGRLARTADQAKLVQAEEMAAKGAGRDDIWGATGWFQGADGKWRFEIPDNAAVASADRPKTMGEKLTHPELYEAYPGLPEIRAQYRARMGEAAYDPGSATSAEKISLPRTERYRLPPDDPFNLESNKSLALHEMQHAIQRRERFAFGDDPKTIFPNDAAATEAAKVLAKERGAPWEHIPPDKVAALKEQAAFEEYRRLAGEVESRNVQIRRNMTPEARQASPPWTTEDIPTNQQIVRDATGKPMMSVMGELADPAAYMRSVQYRSGTPSVVEEPFHGFTNRIPEGVPKTQVVDQRWVDTVSEWMRKNPQLWALPGAGAMGALAAQNRLPPLTVEEQ